MEKTMVPFIEDFIKKEKLNLSVTKNNPFEFWLDDKTGSVTVRFKINTKHHEISYDVYSPEYTIHLKEETIQDVERLESLAENNKKWTLAESIENIWLVLDQMELWARQHHFHITEKQLI